MPDNNNLSFEEELVMALVRGEDKPEVMDEVIAAGLIFRDFKVPEVVIINRLGAIVDAVRNSYGDWLLDKNPN